MPYRDDVGTRPPLLDNIYIASPCKASWEAMVGDDRSRHCVDCNKRVYNLSGMTRDEAEELLGANRDLCTRFYRRADGTIMTSDCDATPRRIRRGLKTAGATAVGLAGAAGALLYGATQFHGPSLGSAGYYSASLTQRQVARALEPELDRIDLSCSRYQFADTSAQVTVRADGSVADVSMLHGPTSPHAFCVASHLRDVRFEHTEYGGTFTYPFRFDR